MDGRKTEGTSRPGAVGTLLRRARHVAAAAALGVGLAGCTPLQQYIHNGFKVGPNYGKPPAPVANQWIDANHPRLLPTTENLDKWWTVFNDPVLDSLIGKGYKQNLSLREAGFRILQARAELGIAVGFLFPQHQDAEGGYVHKGVSVKVANRQATPQRWFDNWANGFGLSWELDFWGKFRREIESYSARLDASIENYDYVLVTLLGDVGTYYTQLRVAQKQLEYVNTNIDLQEKTLDIAKTRFKNGLTSELDADQAESTLDQTKALKAQVEIQIRQAANRLCFLLGIPTVDLQPKLGPGGIPNAPPTVAAGIPCQVLMNRPDVRQAEREAAALSAKIGVADADFYPAVSIVGTLGYAAQEFPQMFNSQAFYGQIGPSFQWNILHYGRIVNHVAFEDARFQEKAVAFQNTVLKANEEAENSIIFYLKSHERAQHLQDSVKANEKAVQIALAQYGAGTVDFNRVSLLEQNLVQQQIEQAKAQGDIALGLVGIYRALGGGWEIRLVDCDNKPPATVLPIVKVSDRAEKDKEKEKEPEKDKDNADGPALP